MKKIISIMLFLLGGCTYQIMTSHPREPRHELDVQMFFSNHGWPCKDPIEMGYIMLKEGSDPIDSVKEARRRAAEIGADFILVRKPRYVINSISNSIILDVYMFGCGQVDRINAPIK